MSKYNIDWKTIEDNYDTLLDEMDEILKENCEKLIDLRRTSPNFFALQVNSNLSIPTTFDPNTVAASIFGCDRYHGDGDNKCNPLCVKDSCKKSVWQLNSNGTQIKCIYNIESTIAHLYAPSSVKDPIRLLKRYPKMLRKIRQSGALRIEVYRMAYSTARYEGTYEIDDIELLDKGDILLGKKKHDEYVREVKRDNDDYVTSAVKFLLFLLVLILAIVVFIYIFLFNLGDFRGLDPSDNIFKNFL